MSEVLSGGHTSSVLCVDVCDSTVASGGEDGEVCIWSTDGTLFHKFVNEGTDCGAVFFSKDKDNTLYASFDNKICVFDLRNFSEPLETFNVNQDEVNQIVVDEKENFLAACDDSGEIKILDIQEKRVYKTLRHKHTNICSSVCFRPKKPWEILTGGLDSQLVHWDFSRPKCLNQFNMQEMQTCEQEAYMVNPPFIHNLAASRDGHYLACALENGLVSVFDMRRKNIREHFSLHAHSQGASQVHFVSDTHLVSGGNDCCVVLWDLEKSAESPSHIGQSNGASALTNGHTHPEEQRNENVSSSCKLLEIQHSNKINWMKPFEINGTRKLAVADQTTNITILLLQ
ncbi:WD repeat-containing protein 53-like [Argopecten irradians]|uniref:WD repeat-containing protein 53-like n=1 Tax=Argopecten irradians TaxID=31199 RepID=UPI00371E93E2